MLQSFITIVAILVSSSLALIHAVDSSSLVSQSTYATALSQGFTKAIIRGYEEACASGGQVDPNFVASYNNARAAGFTNIDTYWFPCSGTTNPCKSYAQQISELGATFTANSMKIGTIWIDLESDTTFCNNWDYGTAENLVQAKAVIAAAQASGFKFGIYSSPGEWSTMFGSETPVVDSSAPLWFATFDNVQSLTMNTPFGGWTAAFAKQYTDVSASGQFDLSVFTA